MAPFAKFASFECTTQSWFVALRSRALKPGRPQACETARRSVVLWRDNAGVPHALDARCPHLGADLGRGSVVEGNLRCPFHGWCFDAGGACVHVPGAAPRTDRSAIAFPCCERHGFIWVYNGPRPLFEIPAPADSSRMWTLAPRGQVFSCHPHLIIGNGLDVSHYEPLHGLAFTRDPEVTVGAASVKVAFSARPKSRLWRFLTGTMRRDIEATFTSSGGNLALAEVFQPLRFSVLFAAQPAKPGQARTQTVFFFPRGYALRLIRAGLVMANLLRDDRRVLESLKFKPEFTAGDSALAAFANSVEALPVGDAW